VLFLAKAIEKALADFSARHGAIRLAWPSNG
jgi:hypothetical protein